MLHNGLFITGTDTGVGKTYIGVLIAKALVEIGIRVVARKPVETGCIFSEGVLIPEDAQALYNASNQSGTLELTCPYRFTTPVSPERAARLEGVKLSLEMLPGACLKGVTETDFLLVEGAGGFYSPLTHDGLNADLAGQLGLPVLLVAANRLGCINHVLLTAESIAKRGLDLRAVILNDTCNTDDSNMDNLADLKPRLDCPMIAVNQHSGMTTADIRNVLTEQI